MVNGTNGINSTTSNAAIVFAAFLPVMVAVIVVLAQVFSDV